MAGPESSGTQASSEANDENESMASADKTENSTTEENQEEEFYDENLLTSGKRILDEEKQSILFEILKCAVCLEIPKGKQNLQVRICEKGHHFCSPCHKKLRKCAICRGRLFIGRNFVVEELITKLGPNLGISKCRIPLPEPPPKLPPGVFRCPHQCMTSQPSGMMLPHMRNNHKENLVDNLRSNPYTGRFDWMFNITLTTDMLYTLSTQVSDMGLFTAVISLRGNDFIGYIQVLGDENIASLYKYQMTARITNNVDNSWNDFTASNCNVSHSKMNFDDIVKSGHILKIDGVNLKGLHFHDLNQPLEALSNEKDILQILFSIWRSNMKKGDKEFEIKTLVPEVPLVYNNDRKIRRNKTRNARKKRLKEKLRSVKNTKSEELVKSMSALKIRHWHKPVKSDS